MTEKSRVNIFQEKVSNNRMATNAMIKAALHEKVTLNMTNYHSHIRKRHPEVTPEIIYDVLIEPDEVYRKSKNGKEFYYYKTIDGVEFKVVITSGKYRRKEVITAYSVLENMPKLKTENSYCSYSKYAEVKNYNRESIRDAITKEYEQLLMCG